MSLRTPKAGTIPVATILSPSSILGLVPPLPIQPGEKEAPLAKVTRLTLNAHRWPPLSPMFRGVLGSGSPVCSTAWSSVERTPHLRIPLGMITQSTPTNSSAAGDIFQLSDVSPGVGEARKMVGERVYRVV